MSKQANQIELEGKTDESKGETIAKALTMPELGAAISIQNIVGKRDSVDLMDYVEALKEQRAVMSNNETLPAEAMLVSQANTLDALFNNLTQRALNADLVKTLEAYLKLALRAQSQARATWEAISAIKNPPVAGYIKQANIAHGHQQVNNEKPASSKVKKKTRAREKQNLQNELLEEDNGEWLDAGASCSASGNDQEMEAVG